MKLSEALAQYKRDIVLIFSTDSSHTIGFTDGTMPYHCPKDLKYFKEKTMGNIVIVGRKTYDTIPKALGGREVIVLSRNDNFTPRPEVPIKKAFTDPYEALIYALQECKEEQKIFVAGGREVFELYEVFATHVYITNLEASCSASHQWYDVQDNISYIAPKHLFMLSKQEVSGAIHYPRGNFVDNDKEGEITFYEFSVVPSLREREVILVSNYTSRDVQDALRNMNIKYSFCNLFEKQIDAIIDRYLPTRDSIMLTHISYKLYESRYNEIRNSYKPILTPVIEDITGAIEIAINEMEDALTREEVIKLVLGKITNASTLCYPVVVFNVGDLNTYDLDKFIPNLHDTTDSKEVDHELLRQFLNTESKDNNDDSDTE